MPKFLKFILVVFLFFAVTFSLEEKVRVVKADINSDCQNEDPAQIVAEGKTDQCTQILSGIASSISAANQTNQKNLSSLQSQLNSINSRLSAMSDQLKIYSQTIASKQSDLGFTQTILNQKTVDNYTRLRTNSDPLFLILLSNNAYQAFQQLILEQKVQSADTNSIISYANQINDLKNEQDTLKKSQDALSTVQKQVTSQATFLAGEVAKANAYLASISARQQAFIAAKLASLGISRSAYDLNGGCSSDISPTIKSPGFSPAFAFFSYGVPNRVGLNQYGALGRANAGQNAQTILQAYYNADYTTNYNDGINIHVVGTNEFGQSFDTTWNIDDYLKHLYEMPTNWPAEALKAQAIAARSFALAYTNNGSGSICPSQSCQVVKQELNNDAWQQAVDATKGIVMTNGGNPIKAWFSATHGGFEFTSSDIGWSSTPWTKRLVDASGSVNSFSDLNNNAYDKSSPVFYCDWGSRAENNHTAWLRPSELADIVNSALLAEKDNSTESHLYQIDKPNPEGTDTWSPDQVRSQLQSRGVTPFNNISNISVNVDFSTGRTTSITASGDAGNETVNGDDFKNYFNLRAPANIQIVGPLYNIEHD
ncbi:MAG TPA: SpoIID/LytB domain-containing protein [Patescibacteria group bacterium]|nr:SpoIID/LytB domain-containing protein [Patescibacteria group bacterium]